ncbi:hypothetical protein BXY64_3305 [Marinifilum flexuosum]|uniref:Uncharacterized protein n=1 Tax=Marinifilum flexuosum TaxID=1117708 RepID=A0A419WSR9_9BACT|nr:hypothetical protein BXY64_3305 [Marinifilum flexuosum]
MFFVNLNRLRLITSPQSSPEEEEVVQRVGGFVMTKFIQTTVYIMQ